MGVRIGVAMSMPLWFVEAPDVGDVRRPKGEVIRYFSFVGLIRIDLYINFLIKYRIIISTMRELKAIEMISMFCLLLDICSDKN